MEQASQDAERVAHQIMRDFPAKLSAIRIRGAAAPLREGSGRLRAAAAEDTVSHCADRARDCLRECGDSDAGAGYPASARICGAAGAGCESRRDNSRSAGGRAAAERGRRAAGLASAAVALKTALVLLPESMPRIDAIHMDSGVAGFALLLAVATGALCSVVPAFAAMRTNLLESLRESGRTSAGDEPRMAAISIGGGGNCDCDDPADCVGGVCAELPEDAGGRSGISAGPRAGGWVSIAARAVWHGICGAAI